MVQEVFATKGWKEVVGPALEDFIQSVVGHKDGSDWKPGTILTASEKERPYSWYAGYATGLMEFHLYLNRILKSRDKVLKSLEEKQSGNEDN